ncbi:MAG: chromosome partitioning ATPase, partial [Inhella sp.]
MASLIEQAAQRLEQLRQAGALAPDALPAVVPAPATRPAEPAPPLPLAAQSHDEPSGRGSKSVELNLNALAVKGYLTPGSPRTPMADQYRVIKRPLIKNA